MGQSISYQFEIADIILPRLGTTLTMVIPAFIIGTITGILFGIIAAKNRGKVIDSVISFFANIGVSMPIVLAGHDGNAGVCPQTAGPAQFRLCSHHP